MLNPGAVPFINIIPWCSVYVVHIKKIALIAPFMDDPELQMVIGALMKECLHLRAQMIVDRARTESLEKAFEKMAEQCALSSASGQSISELLGRASYLHIHQQLAQISDDDPDLASALKQILDESTAAQEGKSDLPE